MATPAVREASRVRVLMDIEALLEARALKTTSASIFDGAGTRSNFTWVTLNDWQNKLDDMYLRLGMFSRLSFAGLGNTLPDDATLAQVKAFVQSMAALLSNGGDIAVVQAKIDSALARITALGG